MHSNIIAVVPWLSMSILRSLLDALFSQPATYNNCAACWVQFCIPDSHAARLGNYRYICRDRDFIRDSCPQIALAESLLEQYRMTSDQMY